MLWKNTHTRRFFIFYVWFIQHFLAIVIWLYEHKRCYAGENREEQNVSFLLSSAPESWIHPALILTPLRKCGPCCMYLGVLEENQGKEESWNSLSHRKRETFFLRMVNILVGSELSLSFTSLCGLFLPYPGWILGWQCLWNEIRLYL